MSIFAGNTSVRELPPSRRYTDTGGWSKVRNWAGTIGELEQLAVALARDGYNEINLDPGSDAPYSGVLSATINKIDESATQDADFDVWELDINSPQVSPENSPYFTDATKNPYGVAISENVVAHVKSKIQSGEPIDLVTITIPTFTSPFLPVSVGFTDADKALAQELYDLLAVDTDMLTDEIVVRLTKTLSSTSTTQVSTSNTLRRIQASTFVDDEGIPALDAAAMDLPTTGEWLKQRPRRVKVAQSKWQIIQEWWYSELGWNYRLYPRTDGKYLAYE